MEKIISERILNKDIYPHLNNNRKTGTYFTLNTINLNKRKKEAIEINPS